MEQISARIRNFEPSFLKDQVALDIEVTKNWKYKSKTNIEHVKSVYEREGFTPETRFYLFNENEMIGFLTSVISKDSTETKVATLRMPIVKPAYRELEAILLHHALDKLHEFGVSKVNTIVSEELGNSLSLAHENDFYFTKPAAYRAISSIYDLSFSGYPGDLINYHKSDQREIRRIYAHKVGLPEKMGRMIFNYINKTKRRKPETMYSWKVAKDEDNKIFMFSEFSRSDLYPNIGRMGPIVLLGDHALAEYVDKAVSAHILDLHPHGLTNVEVFYPGYLENKSAYEKVGFVFDRFDVYEKLL